MTNDLGIRKILEPEVLIAIFFRIVLEIKVMIILILQIIIQVVFKKVV